MTSVVRRRGLVMAVVAALVLLSISTLRSTDSIPPSVFASTDAGDQPNPLSPLTLVVGQVGEMTARNPLPPIANNVPTSAVLYRVYDSVLLTDPKTAELLPYIVKGVDFDEDGLFEVAEYGVFAERAAATSSLEVTLYYDFNGVRWHDGVQLTPWDLYFSYHVNAMNPRFSTNLRVLFCAPGLTYEDCGRQLGVAPAAKSWEGEGSIPGDPNLRVAVRHTLNEAFVSFYGSTIAPVMLPTHLWSRTGGGRHVDFGCAVWIPPAEATSRGIPECGNTDPARWGRGIAATEPVPGSSPYVYLNAEAWNLQDADVVGHGPFRFGTWTPGIEATVTRNEDFFTGVDAQSGIIFDPVLATLLKKPTTDGVRFIPYASADLCAYALNISDVDFCHASLPANVVPDLLANPAVALESNAEAGFRYMGYNMRKAPFGYLMNDPANDVGYWFRQAVAHLADKRYLVDVLLQDLAVVGHGFVSPANTFWYNDNIPKPGFDLDQARAILDDPARGGLAGISPDPPGPCAWNISSGCRVLPGIGKANFEILTPEMSYDPVRATAGAMLAQSMRDVGLNANATQLAFGALVSRVSAPDFDMYILAWRIGAPDPDYLFSFFHSSNTAPSGQNYPGFRNATFDGVIDASRSELDRNARRSLIFQAQSILSDARPYEVLYYLTNVEAYRQDRWVNWSVDAGTIWNYWSLIGIHPPTGLRTITVDTVPTGLEVRVGGAPHNAPYSFPCSDGATAALDVVSPQRTGDTRYVFASWSDGGAQAHTITCTGDATYTATFARQFLIALDSNPTGLALDVSGFTVMTPYELWCVEGSVHTIQALSPQGSYRFVEWSDGIVSPTRAISCLGPLAFVANFIAMFTVTVDSAPSGLQVFVDAVARTTPYAFTCDSGSPHTLHVVTPQGASPTRFAFGGWADGPADNPRAVTCNADETYTANLGTEYLVSFDTSPAGLTLTVDGVSISGANSVWCAAGDSLLLEAPSPQGDDRTRYVFASWSDDGARTRTLPCAAVILTASFRTEHTFTADTSPPGLQVEVDGTGRTAPYAFWCSAGSSVSLGVPTPQGESSTRHVFLSWSDGGAESHAAPCGAGILVTATFQEEHRFTLESSPSGLQINVNGIADVAPYTRWCEEGASLTLTVPTPQGMETTRHVFSAWTDGGPLARTVVCDGPRTLTASFQKEHRMTLTTSPAGLEVVLNGGPVSAPHAFWCVDGSTFDLEGKAQTQVGRRYNFASWSDGGAAKHTVTCSSPATMEVTFETERSSSPPSTLFWVGVFALVVAAIGLALFAWRRRKKPSASEESGVQKSGVSKE